MLIKEYRVVLPMTVEEYQVAQLFAVAEMSKEQSGGDAGVEILKNEPYENPHGKGQYTYKIYHLGSRLPRAITAFLPESALQIHEEAWNGYPHCKTVMTNPFLDDKFQLVIESRHAADRGIQNNIHNLDEKMLKHRDVVNIDIANDKIEQKDYKEEYDPKKFHSQKTGRGPLNGTWIDSVDPVMCCYKLVTLKFKVFGFEHAVENFVGKFEHNLFLLFHRQVFCLMDKWHGMTMEDIRRLEDKAKEELEQKKKEREENQKHHNKKK